VLTEQIDPELLDKAGKSLKVVSQMAVGYDNIDVAACTERGIPVGNTPGVLSETTADLAFALLLASARRVVEAADYVRDGKWQTWAPMTMTGQDLYRSTVGILGMGRIGKAFARRLKGFDCNIIYHQRNPDPDAGELGAAYVDFDTVIHSSDFISIHVPLTEETHHLIGEHELSMMKPNAIIVNTSRGSIIDQKALYSALRNGEIAAAGLDVTDPEPIDPNDPLLKLPNVTVLPHIGSASVNTRTKMAVIAARNLIAGLKGEQLPHCVNPEVYG